MYHDVPRCAGTFHECALCSRATPTQSRRCNKTATQGRRPMKRGVILSATALTMIVATGAHLLATSYQGAPVPAPTAATPIQKASLEIRQAPVPLQVKP